MNVELTISRCPSEFEAGNIYMSRTTSLSYLCGIGNSYTWLISLKDGGMHSTRNLYIADYIDVTDSAKVVSV